MLLKRENLRGKRPNLLQLSWENCPDASVVSPPLLSLFGQKEKHVLRNKSSREYKIGEDILQKKHK